MGSLKTGWNFCEHRAAQMDIGKQRNIEIYHIGTENLALSRAA